MDTDVLIVLILVIALVVVVNGLLVLAMRRGRTGGWIRLWQQAARRTRNPWGEEDASLKELSDLVEKLKDSDLQP